MISQDKSEYGFMQNTMSREEDSLAYQGIYIYLSTKTQ